MLRIDSTIRDLHGGGEIRWKEVQERFQEEWVCSIVMQGRGI